ncbi:MAG: class I SAM-dependent methyltransferase [Terriglobales bacterium]
MPSGFPQQLWSSFREWWRAQTRAAGFAGSASLLARKLFDFVRESTPEQRRRRYGDMEYDWEHRVNTTSGTVGWRARLLGLFHSPYQPTDPILFSEMMASLPIVFEQFTFMDVGSGKGRTLLMASEYPFRRIVGVELIAELHEAAEENLRAYHSATQKCSQIEAVCADACDFPFPNEPLVLYLFNPLPESGMRRMVARLETSLAANPRPAYVLYHNPLLERVIAGSARFEKGTSTAQYCIYSAGKAVECEPGVAMMKSESPRLAESGMLPMQSVEGKIAKSEG